MAAKRGRQSSADSPAPSAAPADGPPAKKIAARRTSKTEASATTEAEERKKPLAARRGGSAPKITNGDVAALVRTAETLAALHTKKTEAEVWGDVVPFQRATTDTDFDAAGMYKFITWNVAGLRGLLKKNAAALSALLEAERPDVLCLQETKLNTDEADANAALGVVDGYVFADHPCAFKRGYSGTRTYVRASSVMKSSQVRWTRGFAVPTAPDAEAVADAAAAAADAPLLVEGPGDEEGRVLTTFITPGAAAASATPASRIAVVNTYVANSGMGLSRLPYRIQAFDPSMREYLQKVDAWATATADKSGGSDPQPFGFVWAGDMNVAERDYDRYYAGTFKSMQECSGFAPEERESFRDTMRQTRSVDVLRHFYPRAGPVYTFWSQRINGRPRNVGWRLDYFVVSARLVPYVVDCFPMPSVMGSDHCPVQLWMRHP